MGLLLFSTLVLVPYLRPSSPGAFNLATLPLSFEANVGQADASVRFLARGTGGSFYFTPTEVVLSLATPKPSQAPESPTDFANGPAAPVGLGASVVRLRFVGANEAPVLKHGSPLPGRVNYLKGNDPSRWQTDVPTFGSVSYSQLYPAVDLSYEGQAKRLKGTYTVAAGGDASRIRWRYEGAGNARVDQGGRLQLRVPPPPGGTGSALNLTEEAPVAWQEFGGRRHPVQVGYDVAPDGTIGFAIGSYNQGLPLVIDPTLTYSTYLGGSGGGAVVSGDEPESESGEGIAVDASGNVYITGRTYSPTGFPTQGPFQATNGGDADAFVTKLDSSGSVVVYSTYLGGTGAEVGRDIGLDPLGNAYVTGATTSPNFPVMRAVQATNAGGSDVFVAKLNPSGSALVYSTYLGGTDFDEGHGIAVAGNSPDYFAYITGGTRSSNFDVTSAAFQREKSSTPRAIDLDAFVTKIYNDNSGSGVSYSSYLGGSNDSAGLDGDDIGTDIAVDGEGNAYVTGETSSFNFPTTPPIKGAPFQAKKGGDGSDAFVTKFNNTGSTIEYSTYLGGTAPDSGQGIAVISGVAYVGGSTRSLDFPTEPPFLIPPPLMTNEPGQSFGDGFVAKLTINGSALSYSHYLGGNESDSASSIAVDSVGNAYLSGRTASPSSFPSLDPSQQAFGGGVSDAFVTKFDPSGNYLYSTHLGGADKDEGNAIAVDASGGAYVTGRTKSTNFPTKAPYQAANRGTLYDAFVTKIGGSAGPPPPPSPSLRIADAPPVAEGTPGAPGHTQGFARFKVSLSAPAITAVSVNYATANGTATAPSDYQAASGTLTFAAGETTKVVTVPINMDGSSTEGDEDFVINLSGPSTGVALGDAQGKATIVGDDPASTATLSVTDVTVSETFAGTTTQAVFTVSLSKPHAAPFSVRAVTSDGTAHPPPHESNDYVHLNQILSFARDETTKQVAVTINGDNVDERDETFALALEDSTGPQREKRQGVGIIANDDGIPTVSIDDISVTEGDAGTTEARFSLTLSYPSFRQISVNYTTADGTARSTNHSVFGPADYRSAVGVANFAPGETTKAVVVVVNGDTVKEQDEDFAVLLTSAVNAIQGKRAGVGTIRNDERA